MSSWQQNQRLLVPPHDQPTTTTTTTTTIDYPVNWRHSNNHNAISSDDDDDDDDDGCSRCWDVISVLILLLIVVSVTIFVHPQQTPLQFEINLFRISSLIITTSSPTNSVTANINLTLAITNQKSLLFESMLVSTHYHGAFISSTSIQPFYLQYGNHKMINFAIDDDAEAVQVSDFTVNDMLNDLAKPRDLELDVNLEGSYWLFEPRQIYAGVKFAGIGVTDRYKCVMKVDCKGIHVEVSSISYNITTTGATGSMIGTPIPCIFTSSKCVPLK